jgi:hypothetical protein
MSGDMMWYEGPGVYCDGVRIADLSEAELVELLLNNDYTVIREDKQEQDQPLGDDPKYRKGHADGVQAVRDYMIKQVGYCKFGE